MHGDWKLFEFLVLEGMQAGLSWMTILKKRENFRRAFDDFDPRRVAAYGDEKIAALLADTVIIRNRAKIAAIIGNAQAVLTVQEEFGAFTWGFVHPKRLEDHVSDPGTVRKVGCAGYGYSSVTGNSQILICKLCLLYCAFVPRTHRRMNIRHPRECYEKHTGAR